MKVVLMFKPEIAELEAKLKELKIKQRKCIEEYRDLNSEVETLSDKANKTQFLIQEDLQKNGTSLIRKKVNNKKISKRFNKDKLDEHI